MLLTVSKNKKVVDSTWDFKKDSTKYNNHGFHAYPAMMIPQIARKLIRTYGENSQTILDPFMGSGTALLEGKLHNQFKKIYGVDINPLARLISKVKTTKIELDKLEKEYKILVKNISNDKSNVNFKQNNIETQKFFNIDFWFKKEVIVDLTIIKNNIEKIKNQDVKDFFLVAFSEVIRKASNTRNGEFKLYRMSEQSLKKFNPKTLELFLKKSKDNIGSMNEFYKESNRGKVFILNEDTRNKTSIPKNSIDLIVTSPPYGDSRTTVAYGQFSRLALQWLGYDSDKIKKIDKISLGGIPTKDLANNLQSEILKQTIEKISKEDKNRARDVLSFYVDFNKCIKELDRVTKRGAFLCFVVGNRTVKGIKIPTDDIIVELFQANNKYKHHQTYIRNILNKKMPKSNSPTNIKGNISETMNQEGIIILEKL